ncbi:nuclear transport factor 2 family protein [Kibdelosporangium persicum]|uniref:SnoaL-like domain-containing protein n=1 Tax=Kibdelosporangium persicum TaxID=2698649 RepID=A0ABX2FDT3_9PSEU|nr:nuclear transport factor 2 family protein [Kibdelosporangium persicum]NRN69531.1 hypothetical protein [Kibdelosporangium persicum]
MSEKYVEFVNRYSAFIESTMPDQRAFAAGLPDFITDESVLLEPSNIFGRLVGFDGWEQWRAAASAMAVNSGVRFTTSASQCFANGDVVLHYYEVEFSPRPRYPDGWRTSIIERFEFADGKIATLTGYYADAAAFVDFFA